MERLEATALHRIAQAIRWHKLDTPAAISDFLLDDPDIVALMKDPANRHEVELDFIESIIVSDDLDEVDKLSAISFATPVAIRSPPPGTPQRRGGNETAASLTKLPAMKILLEGLAHDVVKAQAARVPLFTPAPGWPSRSVTAHTRISRQLPWPVGSSKANLLARMSKSALRPTATIRGDGAPCPAFVF